MARAKRAAEIVSNQLISLASRENTYIRFIRASELSLVSNQLISLASREYHPQPWLHWEAQPQPCFQSINFPSE